MFGVEDFEVSRAEVSLVVHHHVELVLLVYQVAVVVVVDLAGGGPGHRPIVEPTHDVGALDLDVEPQQAKRRAVNLEVTRWRTGR